MKIFIKWIQVHQVHPESHKKERRTIQGVLQTTSSASFNNHNPTDETCDLYGRSFPLTCSHSLCLCHQVPLERSSFFKGPHKDKPGFNSALMQATFILETFSFNKFISCLLYSACWVIVFWMFSTVIQGRPTYSRLTVIQCLVWSLAVNVVWTWTFA